MTDELQQSLFPETNIEPRWPGVLLARLLETPRIGPKRAIAVAEHWPDPASYAAPSEEDIRHLGSWARSLPSQLLPPVIIPSGVKIIGFFDDDYPQQLKTIPNPPAVLWVRGKLSHHQEGIAVVGTRDPTGWGEKVARAAARAAVEAGFSVISGLAIGCDSFAHLSALEFDGHTVAFLGGSLNDPQPSENRGLADEILASGGALVTEVQPDIRQSAGTLVARNRLQSGYSLATVVAQSSIPGGTMHTARFTIEQGRTLIVPVPKRTDSTGPELAGNLALTDPEGCDPGSLAAKGKVADLLRERRPISDFAPRTSEELEEVIRRLA